MYIYTIKKINQIVPPDFINNKIITLQNGNEIIKLNNDYLCDLFFAFYFKYLNYNQEFIKDEFFDESDFIKISLSSRILKKKYGNNYMLYIQYLVENGYIRQIQKYKVGIICNEYKLVIWKIKQIKLLPYINKNYKLIRYYNKELNISKIKFPIYSKNLIKALISNIKHISINHIGAISYLRSQYFEDDQKYLRNYQSIISIYNKNLYLISDDYGRIHTNFTVLKKEIKQKYLLIDGEEIKEKDISNSQAFFFLLLLSKNLSKAKINKAELIKCKEEIFKGILYDNLAAIAGQSRDFIKEKFFEYLFGKSTKTCKEFNKQFPGISSFIKEYKEKLGDYKKMSHQLQALEGSFLFNKVCKQLVKKKIIFFTVHDSVCTKISDFQLMSQIFDSQLENLKQVISLNIEKFYSKNAVPKK